MKGEEATDSGLRRGSKRGCGIAFRRL